MSEETFVHNDITYVVTKTEVDSMRCDLCALQAHCHELFDNGDKCSIIKQGHVWAKQVVSEIQHFEGSFYFIEDYGFINANLVSYVGSTLWGTDKMTKVYNILIKGVGISYTGKKRYTKEQLAVQLAAIMKLLTQEKTDA